jgi:HlyD family secretion protein
MTRTTKKRIIVWGTLALVLVAMAAIALQPQPVAVEVAGVDRGLLRVTLDQEGRTRVRDRFVVSAPVSGRVLRIELQPGDRVRAGGTALARFLPAQPVPLDVRSRSEAQARVRAAQAALERARAARARAQTERDLAQSELVRSAGLAKNGWATEQQLAQDEATAKAREDDLRAAEAGVEAALYDLQAANASLIEPDSLHGPGTPPGALVLRSPVDGVVLRRLHESEAVVPAGEPLVEVGDPTRLEIIADYLSADAVRIRPGMPVLIEQWGGAGTLAGSVRRVEPAGFTKVSALGVEEQRVWVVIDFASPQPQAALGDGYRVETRVVVYESKDVLRIPTSALFRHGQRWAAFIVENGRARLREVDIGERDASATQVVRGVRIGESVIVYPPDGVADGVRVVRQTAG